MLRGQYSAQRTGRNLFVQIIQGDSFKTVDILPEMHAGPAVLQRLDGLAPQFGGVHDRAMIRRTIRIGDRRVGFRDHPGRRPLENGHMRSDFL